MQKDTFIHETAVIDTPCTLGAGCSIWHFVHICEGARLGNGCKLGQNVMIGAGVSIGNNVKIQNNVSVYTGTVIEDDVFLGPSCVLTNISNPRSQIIRHSVYEPTRICRGTTVGANATIVCGVTLGVYSFIAAGAVVTKNVSDYALVMGVPGVQVGWVSRHGHRLNFNANGIARCPESGFSYLLSEDSEVRCLDLAEESPLPNDLALGTKSYTDFKTL